MKISTLRRAIVRNKGNVAAAARSLEISRTRFYSLFKKSPVHKAFLETVRKTYTQRTGNLRYFPERSKS